MPDDSLSSHHSVFDGTSKNRDAFVTEFITEIGIPETMGHDSEPT